MKKTILLVLLLSSLQVGCMVSPYDPPEPQPSDPAAYKLAEAATSVSSSLTTLEGINKAENPQYQKKLPSANSFGMYQLTSIDWTGPVGPIVSKIARVANYRLSVLGNPPAIPVIIAIHAENLSLGEILRNIDYQAGQQAYIYVNARTRTIELRYA